jgi:hypothetical protein
MLSTLPNPSDYYDILVIKTIILDKDNRRKVFNSQILFNFFDEQGRYRRRSDGCSSCRAYF